MIECVDMQHGAGTFGRSMMVSWAADLLFYCGAYVSVPTAAAN